MRERRVEILRDWLTAQGFLSILNFETRLTETV
jgi:hypothetical protein